ncbi:MAG: hypothetical protein B7Z14_02930, partial [Bosea sp. 32-68-6]
TLSLNVGITPDLSGIAGAEQHGIPVKPISSFIARLDALLEAAARAGGPRRIVLVGGGAAGVELALALKARLTGLDPKGRPFWIGLAASNGLVATLNDGVRRRARAALARHGVTLLDDFRVVEINAQGLRAQDKRFVTADAVLVSTAARAPSWLATTGLPTDRHGFVQTTRSLTCIDDPAVFAVGDCATVAEDPTPKAGVFAVRQGAALTANLRHRARGEALAPHRPDRNYLTILMTGDGSAIAGRGGWFAVEGRWVWRKGATAGLCVTTAARRGRVLPPPGRRSGRRGCTRSRRRAGCPRCRTGRRRGWRGRRRRGRPARRRPWARSWLRAGGS